MKYYPSLRMTDTNKYLSFEAFKSFQFGITEKMSKIVGTSRLKERRNMLRILIYLSYLVLEFIFCNEPLRNTDAG